MPEDMVADVAAVAVLAVPLMLAPNQMCCVHDANRKGRVCSISKLDGVPLWLLFRFARQHDSLLARRLQREGCWWGAHVSIAEKSSLTGRICDLAAVAKGCRLHGCP
eukprot:3065634-Prymnesium_polylepis.1